MKSAIVKRSVIIDGHKTSVSLEDAFWKGLREIAIARGATLSNLVAAIDLSVATVIYRQPFGSSCSIIIKPGQTAITKSGKRHLRLLFRRRLPTKRLSRRSLDRSAATDFSAPGAVMNIGVYRNLYAVFTAMRSSGGRLTGLNPVRLLLQRAERWSRNMSASHFAVIVSV